MLVCISMTGHEHVEMLVCTSMAGEACDEMLVGIYARTGTSMTGQVGSEASTPLPEAPQNAVLLCLTCIE